MGISIIIPIYIIDEETIKMTKECIESYRKIMRKEDEVIVVDDCSPYPHDIPISIKSAKNSGNAHTWNLGAKIAKNPILLFSDNDIIAREMTGFREMIGTVTFPLVWNLKTQSMQNHVAGECWAIRLDDFDRIGWVNEEYGSYFEDTDYFMRVIRSGGTLKVCNNAVVNHISQGTFSKVKTPEELKQMFDRNKKLYESKFGQNYPFLS